MGSIKQVANNAKAGTSTAGFPKAVQNKKSSNKSTVPVAPYKMGGKTPSKMMKKGGKMC